MNFYELAEKLRAIEENTGTDSSAGVGDSSMSVGDSSAGGNNSAMSMTAECGDEMPHIEMPKISNAPKQSDSVTMNVSMNGAGAGGISDLMKILRNIEQASDEPSAEPVVAPSHGANVHGVDAIVLGDNEMEEEWGNSAPNSSGQHDFDTEKVINPPSDDMSANVGDHTMRQTGLPVAHTKMHEGLVDRLQKLYNDVKLRESVSTNHRHHASAPRVSSMEHHGHGEFTAMIDGQQYHIYAPVDFGSSHDDEPRWVGSVTVKDGAGAVIHHNDPRFRAIDDELDKISPAELAEAVPAVAAGPAM